MPRSRLLACTALLSLLPSLDARAHAILIDSLPTPEASIPAGRLAIHLRYNSRIDAGRSRLTLTGPDGGKRVLAIAPSASPEILDTSADLAPGGYSLRWQVLAIDGHITRGDVPFTVTPARGASPTAAR